MKGVTADLVGCQCEPFVKVEGTNRCGKCRMVVRAFADGTRAPHVVVVSEVTAPTLVTQVGEEVAGDPRLMDLRDAGSGMRACELLHAAANGVDQHFDAADARAFAHALRALGDKHRDKPKIAIIMSVKRPKSRS